MWFIIVILILILLPFIYLLFVPFFIEIDSRSDLYRLRLHRLAMGSIVYKDGSLFIRIRILWWQRDYDLLAKRQQEKKQTANEQSKRKQDRAGRFHVSWHQIKALVMSFRVNKCYIMIDTGDMPLNAILYPWFFILSKETDKTIMINFQNENTIALEIENNIAGLLWAFIQASKNNFLKHQNP